MLNVKRLVAIDLVLHAPKFVLFEYGLTGLALLTLAMVQFKFAPQAFIWFSYLFSLGLNYVPLFAYAVFQVKSSTAEEEAALGPDGDAVIRRYTLLQLWILVPLAIPLMAAWQELTKRKPAPPSVAR